MKEYIRFVGWPWLCVWVLWIVVISGGGLAVLIFMGPEVAVHGGLIVAMGFGFPAVWAVMAYNWMRVIDEDARRPFDPEGKR